MTGCFGGAASLAAMVKSPAAPSLSRVGQLSVKPSGPLANIHHLSIAARCLAHFALPTPGLMDHF